MELTSQAQDALINTSPREGAWVPTDVPAATRELLDNGLISSRFRLTRRGLIQRERIVNARLEAAFGPEAPAAPAPEPQRPSRYTRPVGGYQLLGAELDAMRSDAAHYVSQRPDCTVTGKCETRVSAECTGQGFQRENPADMLSALDPPHPDWCVCGHVGCPGTPKSPKIQCQDCYEHAVLVMIMERHSGEQWSA